jgi:hypothetical protein
MECAVSHNPTRTEKPHERRKLEKTQTGFDSHRDKTMPNETCKEKSSAPISNGVTDTLSTASRVTVGNAQRTRLWQEVSGICPFCGLELIGSLQIHHIDRDSSNTVDENLLAVCASCHEPLTRTATISTTEPSVLAKVSETKFANIANHHPELWRRVAIALANRLRERSKFQTPPRDQPVVFVDHLRRQPAHTRRQIITRPGPGRSTRKLLLRIFVRSGQLAGDNWQEATVSESVS